MSGSRWALTCVVAALAGALATVQPSPGVHSRRRPIPPPPTLAATGFSESGPGILPFTPSYPLWSDGAEKSRWIWLPPGARLTPRAARGGSPLAGEWDFPVGAKLWKEFRAPGASAGVVGRRLETRFIWRASAHEWVFATYLWNEDETEAVLAPPGGRRLEVELGGGVHHVVPGASDCQACHEAGRGPVLGFTPLQLAEPDPLAPHAEARGPGHLSLAELESRGLIAAGDTAPRDRDLQIEARTPTERAALGYLASNCGPCHNATGPLARMGFDLADPARALASLVDVASDYQIPGQPRGLTRRVTPGEPGRSALIHRMHASSPMARMPPLGTLRRDESALELIERWVRDELPLLPPGPPSGSGARPAPASADPDRGAYLVPTRDLVLETTFAL